MPASKKRSKIDKKVIPRHDKNPIPLAIRDWVHRWHGTTIHICDDDASIFHLGSKTNRVSFWKQFIQLPSKSLFHSVKAVNSPRQHYKEFIYVLLNMRWPMLMTALISLYALTVLVFAFVMNIGCGEPQLFIAAFALSYHTYTTIGFGNIFPEGMCCNIVSVLESFFAILMTAAITGLAFAKFTRPDAKVAFSNVCVIQPYGPKHLALIIRVANATESTKLTDDVIMDANFKLNLFVVRSKLENKHNEQERESQCNIGISEDANNNGDTDENAEPPNSRRNIEPQRDCCNDSRHLRHYTLKLVQSNFITFRMGIAVVHVIDEESPFYGLTREKIMMDDMILEIAVSGVNSTLQDTISIRYMYTKDDLRWGYKFVKLLDFDELNEKVILNFDKLSEVEEAPINENTYVHLLAKKSIMKNSRNLKLKTISKTRHKGHVNGESDNLSSSMVNIPFHRTKLLPGKSSEGTNDTIFAEMRHNDTNFGDLDCSKTISPTLDLYGKSFTNSPNRDSLNESIQSFSSYNTKFSQGSTSIMPSNRILPCEARTNAISMEEGDEVMNIGDKLSSPTSTDYKAFENASPSASFQNSRQTDRTISSSNRVNHSSPTRLAQRSKVKQTLGFRKRTSKSPLADQAHDTHVFNEADEYLFDWVSGQQDYSHRHDSNVTIDVQDRPKYVKISPINIPESMDFLHLYHRALYMKWPKIFLMCFATFIGTGFIFALIYWLDKDGMEINPAVNITDKVAAFVLSVHILTTIGYGSVAPSVSNLYMTTWVFIQAIVGLVITTIITGISWSKFSRPRGHIHFSSSVVISTVNGVRCLAIRAANTRHAGDVHEVVFRVGVILTNQRTGLRQVFDVPLVQTDWPTIKLPATLVHVINPTSPFYKLCNMQTLSAARMSLVVLFTGFDTTFTENVYSRKIYFWDDFRFNAWFADFAIIERDRILVDFVKFDEVVEDDDDTRLRLGLGTEKT